MAPRQYTLLFRSSQQLPGLRLRPLMGSFELTLLLSRALDLHRAVFPDLQINKHAVRCDALGAEIPRHHHTQLMQTLIVRLSKTHFFHTDP